MKSEKTFLAAAGFAAIFLSACFNNGKNNTVKVGILHSTTGTMASSESSVINAEKMAIDEINEKGGVLGKKIQIVQADGKSDANIFAEEARRLWTKEGVAAIFGCWTSASRKAVQAVLEEPDIFGLLWYPLQYEGMEASPNIMYIGAAPNQQVVPSIEYCVEKFGKRMYLIGSDYIFPRTANKIIKALLKNLEGVCAGESYVPLESMDFEKNVQEIIASRPDIIINTINGDSNKAFFEALRKAGITPKDIPVMSFSISEEEVSYIGAALLEGEYVTWNYFQTIASFKNKNFVQRYKELYGADKSIGDPMEAAYVSVYLWSLACEKAGTFDVEPVRMAAKGLSFDGPNGIVKIDASNQHLQQKIRIGRINSRGMIDTIWESSGTVKPDPYLSAYAWAKGLQISSQRRAPLKK